MTTSNDNTLAINAPSLPKGGGAIQSIGKGWGGVGTTGAASLELPLPISKAPNRSLIPALSLGYSSDVGNSPFGIGWRLTTNAITLRTSTIGHELGNHHGLLEWFLAQSGSVRGFRKAIYSGLSTREFARVIRDYVIPRPKLRGLFHVSGDVITKYDLLLLIRDIYGKQIAVDADDAVAIDRSLDSSRFRGITGYAPPPWVGQIREMHDFG